MDKILLQFMEIAEHKNVTRAANKLNLSQPTLTHNMKKLESNLGVELFVRHSNGINLTIFGELLFKQVQQMFHIHNETIEKINSLKLFKETTIRIGTGHVWWETILKNIIFDYEKNNKDLNLHIDVGNHLRLMDLLLSDEIDLFLGHEIHGLTTQKGINFIPIFTSRETSFISNNHPLAKIKCTKNDLIEFPLLDLTPDETRFKHLIGDLYTNRKEGIQTIDVVRKRFSTNSITTAIDILKTTNAILEIYPSSMEGFFKSFDILVLETKDTKINGIVGIYTMKHRKENRFIKDLTDLIKSYTNKNREKF